MGTDLNAVGSQYLIGDQSNQNPKVPAYWVVNMHTSYKINKNVEVFGLVQNLFNQRYYAAGTFFDTRGISLLTFNDPRTFVPGMPLAAYAGIARHSDADPSQVGMSAIAPTLLQY